MSLSRSVIKANDVVWRADDWSVIPPERPELARVHTGEAAHQFNPTQLGGLPMAPAKGRDPQQALLQEAAAQAQQMLETARQDTAELVRQAREQAAEVTRQARLEGLAAAEIETGQMLLSAKGVLDEMRAWREAVLAGGEQAVLQLVTEVAQALFGEGLALPPETLHAAFNRAVAEAKPLGDLRIHVHPDDAALLDPHWPEQQAALVGQRLELVPDSGVRRGGCLVDGQYGSVDARVDTQLETVRLALVEAAHGSLPAPAPLAGGEA